MGEETHMKYDLQYTEIYEDDKLKGIAFCDTDTDYIRFQVAAPTAERATWHVVEVCRGGEDPFEFVSLGYTPTRRTAFSLVRKAWTAFALNDAVRRHREGKQS